MKKLKQSPERRLALRLAAFAYEKCIEHDRRGRNIVVSQIEQRIIEHIRIGDLETWLLTWFDSVLWIGANRKDYSDVTAIVVKEFIETYRPMIAEGVLST